MLILYTLTPLQYSLTSLSIKLKDKDLSDRTVAFARSNA